MIFCKYKSDVARKKVHFTELDKTNLNMSLNLIGIQMASYTQFIFYWKIGGFFEKIWGIFYASQIVKNECFPEADCWEEKR